MRTEDGFTVAELLAALVVLSLGMGLVGDAIFSQAGIWNRLTDDQARIRELVQIYPLAREAESRQVSLPSPGIVALHPDAGAPLELAAPRVTHTAECVFDTIGRSCR